MIHKTIANYIADHLCKCLDKRVTNDKNVYFIPFQNTSHYTVGRFAYFMRAMISNVMSLAGESEADSATISPQRSHHNNNDKVFIQPLF